VRNYIAKVVVGGKAIVWPVASWVLDQHAIILYDGRSRRAADVDPNLVVKNARPPRRPPQQSASNAPAPVEKPRDTFPLRGRLR
jgi:hypothetical protein